MALVQTIKDGQIVESASQSSLKKSQETTSTGMDKDAFLQLLVAQMKYQDPMEPTSNTEYISQYAQFSQVEQMQNMSSSMDLQRASALVGEEVYIKTTSSTGDTKYVQGKVDYVVYENGKAYLSIDEQLYSMDDLDTVADKEYLSACNKATEYVQKTNKLPSLENLTISDSENVLSLKNIYDEMTDYEKSFVASDVKTKIDSYVSKISELKTAAEQQTDEQANEE